MILKMKRGVNWFYIDNILDLTIEKSETVSTLSFIYSRWHKTGVIAKEAIDCDDIVYLLNDEGKTIEAFNKSISKTIDEISGKWETLGRDEKSNIANIVSGCKQ